MLGISMENSFHLRCISPNKLRMMTESKIAIFLLYEVRLSFVQIKNLVFSAFFVFSKA